MAGWLPGLDRTYEELKHDVFVRDGKLYDRLDRTYEELKQLSDVEVSCGHATEFGSYL